MASPIELQTYSSHRYSWAVKAANDRVLAESYAKAVLFDYSYRYFYADGYGKDYRIFNLPKDELAHKDAYLTAALLGFYQQLRMFTEVTKTVAGKRSIKLLAPALTALTAQKAHTFLAGNEVFQNPRTGERWAGDQPIRKTMWARAMKKAGVRYRRPYQTRHTFASMMLSAGEHPMWVAKQMGHTDWTMIARVYGRWMPTSDDRAGSKAEEAFRAKANEISNNCHDGLTVLRNRTASSEESNPATEVP